MNIGQRLKRLRTKNGLTLEELANRSELTKGFLSQVERELTSPSISNLSNILEALGVTLGEFFKDTELTKKVFSQEDFFLQEEEGYQIQWIVPNAQKNKMEPILIEIASQEKSKVIEPHEGEEFGFVLSGKIELILEDESLVVKKGQTFYIDGNQAHYLINKAKSNAQVLWICTPPIF